MLDIIRLNPEHHDQASWVSFCGTTRCVAGWVAYLHPELLEDLNGNNIRYLIAGAKGLDIDLMDANRLFGNVRPGEVIHAMEYLAKGEPIDWEAVRNR